MSTTKLAFQPWARSGTDVTALKDTLARVNFERGHFRDINEATLQEEIVQDGAIDMSESDEGEDEDEDLEETETANGKPQTREDLYKARFEMLQYVSAAEQDVLLALDFVSMLQSKDALARSVTTISRDLKNAIPTGSLGTDIWQRVPADKTRDAQDQLLATNVRMEGLQQSADSLLSAATRLKDSVRKETQYWDQILSISDKGWNVCRLPGQKHKLAVTYGFSESTSEFSRRGIAALNTDSDGNILLDRGVGRKPKALRVTIKKSGNVVGLSKIPALSDDGETTLEARIRHARDSLFDEELYHEMIRESRSMSSIGVKVTGSGISYKADTKSRVDMQEVLIELVSSDEIEYDDESRAEDSFAQAGALAARLLLSQAHRSRLEKRGEIPPPISDRKDDKPLLPILRPLISFMLHRSVLAQVNGYLLGLESMMSSAKISTDIQKAQFRLPEVADLTNVKSLTGIMLRPWVSDAEFKVDDLEGSPFSIGLRIETTLGDWSGSMVTIMMPNEHRVRFGDVEEAQEACDGCIAFGLAQALRSALPGDWKCNGREASITQIAEDEDESKKTKMWIGVDHNKEILSLSSPTRTVSWSATGESHEKSFWNAWQDVAEQATE